MATRERKKVLCDCCRCESSSLLSRQLRMRHRQKYGTISQTANTKDLDTFMSLEAPNADTGSSIKDLELFPHDNEPEAPLFSLSELLNSERNLSESFPYSKVSTAVIPEPYRKNFQWLAWKTCCNVSDRAFNESIDLQGNGYMKLESCRNALVQWTGLKAVEIDCCRCGKLK